MARGEKREVCKPRRRRPASGRIGATSPSIRETRAVSTSDAAAARTRVRSASAINSTGGDSVRASVPSAPSSATFTPKTDVGLWRRAVERRWPCRAFRSLRRSCRAARSRRVRRADWPRWGTAGGWEVAGSGVITGALVSLGAVGAGDGCGCGAASTLSAPGAASGLGALRSGAGSGAGTPPESGTVTPPPWAEADGAASAATSTTTMGVSARMDLSGRCENSSHPVVSRTDAPSARRSRARGASSSAPR
jgi:hypothetical protein